MTRIDPHLLAAVAALADDLDGASCAPEDAKRRLARLRCRFPDDHLDVVSDDEAFDGRPSYDVIARQGDGLTFSIAVTSGPGLPWPLRSATRAREYDLLRVGTVRLAVADALATLDHLWDDQPLLLDLVNACIVAAALEEEPVELGPDELQEAANAFRRAKGLLRAEDTERWLADRGLSRRKFADLVSRAAAVAQLRRRVTTAAVEPWFANHGHDLARLLVAWAARPAAGGDARGADWPPLRADGPLAAVIAARRAGRPAGVGDWLACDLPEHLSAVAGVPAGTVVPVEVDGFAADAVVIEEIPAVLDDATRRGIERRLFDEWLADRRRHADIEWFWGDRARTSQVV